MDLRFLRYDWSSNREYGQRYWNKSVNRELASALSHQVVASFLMSGERKGRIRSSSGKIACYRLAVVLGLVHYFRVFLSPRFYTKRLSLSLPLAQAAAEELLVQLDKNSRKTHPVWKYWGGVKNGLGPTNDEDTAVEVCDFAANAWIAHMAIIEIVDIARTKGLNVWRIESTLREVKHRLLDFESACRTYGYDLMARITGTKFLFNYRSLIMRLPTGAIIPWWLTNELERETQREDVRVAELVERNRVQSKP